VGEVASDLERWQHCSFNTGHILETGSTAVMGKFSRFQRAQMWWSEECTG